MKTYTISAKTIASAAKRQWKTFLAFVLAFAVLGAAGGALFAGRGSSEAGGGGAEPLPPVDLDGVARTPVYYSDCLQAMADVFDRLDDYMTKAFTVTLPEDRTEELLELQAAVSKEKREFEQNMLVPLKSVLEENGALYVPEEFMEGLADQYASQLSSIEFEILSTGTSTETIRQMGALGMENGAVASVYLTLIKAAADYGDLLKSQAALEKALAVLREEPERVRAESLQVEADVVKAAAELNALLEHAWQAADEVGKAADERLTLQPNGLTYDIVVKHTYRAVPVAESFAAIELFCVLTGVCAGAFFAVCREAKEEKQRAAVS